MLRSANHGALGALFSAMRAPAPPGDPTTCIKREDYGDEAAAAPSVSVGVGGVSSGHSADCAGAHRVNLARRAVDNLISAAVGEQRREHHRVDLVAGTIGAVGADDRRAGQGEIADGVERLVAHEFVDVAQAFGVEHRVAVESDGIFKRRTKRKAGLPKLLDVADEAEGAGAGNIFTEGRGIEVEGAALATNRRRLEIDFNVEAQTATARFQFG